MAHKSILVTVCVDEVGHAHDCQHNKRHRLERGNRRLKVRKDRSYEHFCVTCALQIIQRDVERLHLLAMQLRGESPLPIELHGS
jgi:hypothetical protein